MTVLFASLLGAGILLCVFAALWWWRTRHVRAVWRTAAHDTNRAAIVLELEDRVREVEQLEPTIDLR